VIVAERVSELVGAQQSSLVTGLVEVPVEIDAAGNHLPAVIGNPPAEPNRVGEALNAFVAANDNLSGPNRIDQSTRGGGFALHRCEGREGIAGEHCQGLGQLFDEKICFGVGELFRRRAIVHDGGQHDQ
jgi:hypothetical protein